jgi:putative membrane protein
MIYLYAKAIHIIFVVCWMAGLFYMVRLFIYHAEAKERPPHEFQLFHTQFTLMEARLWWIITTPAMYLTLISAITMLYVAPTLLYLGWMQVKLVFVAGLIIYHFTCQRIHFRLKGQKSALTSNQLRLFNELSTLLLFAIVFTVVLKSTMDWVFGVVGIVSVGVLLMLGIRIYKRLRNK